MSCSFFLPKKITKFTIMQILLTGGTGFIGSHILKLLSDRGHTVTVAARNPNKVGGLQKLPGVTVVEAQLSDFEKISQLVKGKDAVIHVALDYADGAVAMLTHDTLGSVHLFEQSALAGVKQIIYTSSTASVDFLYMTEFGRKQYGGITIDETLKPYPTSCYGATKAASELYLLAISHEHDLRVNIIRPGYIFGNPIVPGADTQPDGRFREIVQRAKTNEDIVVVKNDGTQFLSASHIARVYDAVLANTCQRETFFALGTTFISWEEISKYTIDTLQSSSKLVVEDRGYAPGYTMFGVSKIENHFGLRFDAEWDEIKKHIAYFASL